VCGGASLYRVPEWKRRGLSPRVRGSPLSQSPLEANSGSIPACAGEPDSGYRNPCVPEVYPRVCGGAKIPAAGIPERRGLSPRVRGSQAGAIFAPASFGSIPACAGEPSCDAFTIYIPGVYPRVCGGAQIMPRVIRDIGGLSPRVRGSRRGDLASPNPFGSIPACAGEPRVNASFQTSLPVYPRVCGGATTSACSLLSSSGLSPRVRGSRRKISMVSLMSGSIPACAGEPIRRSRARIRARVYPRVCGGAVALGVIAESDEGLSPRVRGSQHGGKDHVSAIGSIPACAGEPCATCHSRRFRRVYPRVCGGAIGLVTISTPEGGLSPRVRGSHR